MAAPAYGYEGDVYFGASLYAYANYWEFTGDAELTHEGVFGSAGWKKAWTGQKSLTGTVRCKYNVDTPLEAQADIGDSVVLKLYLDATHFWTFTAKITSFNPVVDGVTGPPVEVTIGFASDGAVTDPVW